MSGGDRLSSLPDDLLHRILHFAPARETESTSALSKRWRGLWRSSGAVNLEERLDEEEAKDLELEDERFFSRRDAFVCAARLSLEAAGSPVTRLTFRMEMASGSSRYKPFHFLYVDTDGGMSTDVVAEFLSLPAARRVEELRLAVGYSGSGSGHHICSNHEVMSSEWPDAWSFNTLKVISLPSENLRVLETTGFKYPEPSVGGVVFPVLASLRLSLCRVWAEHLQDIIHAAPVLAAVHLESVIFLGESPNKKQPPPEEGLVIRLHCPAATALVLDRCCWAEKMHQGCSGTTAVEINAPRLRRFTYKGFLRRLSLSSQAPELARVELHILPHVYHSFDRDARRELQTFWRLAQNFSNAKELKLRVNSLENIAVVGKASRAELLCSFPNRDLRINLTTANADKGRGDSEGRCYLEKKYRHDLNKSIHAFKNRRSEPMVSTERDYYDDDDDDDAILCDKLPKLTALTGHVFHCLQSSLSCFRLQFRLETTDIFGVKSTNRFGVKLIRIFAENAMVLKEMHIDAGNAKMFAHINSKVEKWVANSSEKRKMSFIVLPLER